MKIKFLTALKRRRISWSPILLFLGVLIPNILIFKNRIWLANQSDGCAAGSPNLSDVKDFDLSDPNALKNGRRTFQCYFQNSFQVLSETWAKNMKRSQPRGVIMSAGTPYSLTNAFVNLYTLRHHLKSDLPFVIMYWGAQKEDRPTNATINFFKAWIPNISFMDLSLLPYPAYHLPLQRDDDFNGWKVKIFALYSAPFKEVLYLDSDNMPLFNPEFLFDDENYKLHGSMFWPDILCGSANLHKVLGMPASRVAQTESGQYLFDRERHWEVMEWLLWLNTRDKVVYKEAYGDKDTFKAAFYLAGRLEEFHQVSHPLGVGLHNISEKGNYPLRGFIQFAPNSSALFMHRVAGGKYDPKSDEKRPVSLISLPSCGYFRSRGWNPYFLAGSHAKRPPVDHSSGCNYNLHNLHSSALKCSGYNTRKFNGKRTVPVFKVPANSYASSMFDHSDKTFELILRSRRNTPGVIYTQSDLTAHYRTSSGSGYNLHKEEN